MTKVIICLIQYLVLITMQMVSQIAVCDDLNDKQTLKGYAKKTIHVKKREVQMELKTNIRNQSIIV
jgi:hypothetical protein